MESYIHPDHLQGFCEQFLTWQIWCELGVCVSIWSPADGNAAGPRTTLGEALVMTLAELFISCMSKSHPQLAGAEICLRVSDTRLWKIGGGFYNQLLSKVIPSGQRLPKLGAFQ